MFIYITVNALFFILHTLSFFFLCMFYIYLIGNTYFMCIYYNYYVFLKGMILYVISTFQFLFLFLFY